MSEQAKRRWVYFGLVVLAVTSVFILIIGYLDYSPVNPRNIARIRHGMTERVVVQILGRPAHCLPFAGVKMCYWSSRHGACTVTFDQHGDVLVWQLHEPDGAPPLKNLVLRAQDLFK